jgi:hypothetical protein
MMAARSAKRSNPSRTRICRCGNGPAVWRIHYDRTTRRGISAYTGGPACMRCVDKEAFAVMARGVMFVKVTRYN